MDSTETKRCRTCHEIKPVTCFHKDGDKKSGYRATCKDCRMRKEFRRGSLSEYEIMILDTFSNKEVVGGLDFERPRRMGQLLSNMHKREWVERITDKKPYFYKLTKKGKKVLDNELKTEIIENMTHINNFKLLQDEFDLYGIEMIDVLYGGKNDKSI